jgi:hypothetical protein
MDAANKLPFPKMTTFAYELETFRYSTVFNVSSKGRNGAARRATAASAICQDIGEMSKNLYCSLTH